MSTDALVETLTFEEFQSIAGGAVVTAAADEVSAAIAALFAEHAQQYQAISTQAAAFHDQFVNLLSSSSTNYAAST